MKIACIGNMNNIIFPTAKLLHNRGYQVVLYYLNEYEHFKPIPEEVPEGLEIKDLGWTESNFNEISKVDILRTFEGVHLFIGTDYSPAFLAKANIVLDIYMPAGTDFFDWPFKKGNSFLIEKWEINKIKCARKQLFGIRHCDFLSMDSLNPILEHGLKNIKHQGTRINALPLFTSSNEGELSNTQKTLEIIQHGRQSWGYGEHSVHDKGNNILFEGLAILLKRNKKLNLRITLLNYGDTVSKSQKVILELGIEKHIRWIQKMDKSYLLKLLPKFNIVVGNLTTNGVLSYGTVYDALFSNIAFMGYRKDELYDTEYPELYPMINVATPEEVADRLEYYYHNREELATMGEQGYNWLMNYAINPSVKTVLEIVENHTGRKKLPIDWKLIGMRPYFWFIKFYNFFRIRFGK